MPTEFVVTLFKLRAEAQDAEQPFLAHLIGLAILEANEVINKSTPTDGTKPS